MKLNNTTKSLARVVQICVLREDLVKQVAGTNVGKQKLGISKADAQKLIDALDAGKADLRVNGVNLVLVKEFHNTNNNKTTRTYAARNVSDQRRAGFTQVLV